MVTDVAEAVLPRRGAQKTLNQPDKQDHYGSGQGRKLLQGTLLNRGKKKKEICIYAYMYELLILHNNSTYVSTSIYMYSLLNSSSKVHLP